MKTQFSFLTAGPTFNVTLPDDFEGMPELSSPLYIWDCGGRSYDFIPRERDDRTREDRKLLTVLKGRDGHTVEVYERLDPPRQWYLRWILSSGSLWTHLRDEDGIDRAEPIAANLGIVENGGLPFLLPSGPIKRDTTTRPGYQEFANFFPRASSWTVELQRPGELGEGRVMEVPGGMIFRAGAGYGIDALVHGGDNADEGRKLAEDTAASLGEA